MNTPSDVAVGDRFEPIEVLGRSRHGSVILAADRQLGRRVILKRQRRSAATSVRVRQLLNAPAHPNLALVRDDIGDAREHVLVIDFVDGEALRSFRRNGGLSRADALACAADINAALAHLHELDAPVAHGGVSRRNVILTEREGRNRAILVGATLGSASVRGDQSRARGLTTGLLARSGVVRARRNVTVGALSAAFLMTSLVISVLSARGNESPHGAVQASPRTMNRVPSLGIHESLADAALPATSLTLSIASGDLPAASAQPLPVAAAPQARSRIAVLEHRAEVSGGYPASVDVFRVDGGDMPGLQRKNYGELPQFSQMVTISPGWLFMYSPVDGVIATVPVSGDGAIGWGDTIPVEQGWTDTAGDGHGLVWLYRSDSGALELIRHRNGWHTHYDHFEGLVPAGYDNITALDPNHALLYRSKTGEAVLLTAGDDVSIRTIDKVQLPAGFVDLAYTGQGLLVGVHGNGEGALFEISQRVVRLTQHFVVGGAGWSAVVGFDRGFVVYSPLRLSAVYAVVSDKGAVASHKWQLPAGPITAIAEV